MIQPQEEEKEFLTLQEAADFVGIKRASLYYYINGLNITVHKFPLNRHAYLSASDVQHIKDIKDRPWILDGRMKKEEPSGSVTKKEEVYAAHH